MQKGERQPTQTRRGEKIKPHSYIPCENKTDPKLSEAGSGEHCGPVVARRGTQDLSAIQMLILRGCRAQAPIFFTETKAGRHALIAIIASWPHKPPLFASSACIPTTTGFSECERLQPGFLGDSDCLSCGGCMDVKTLKLKQTSVP